MALQESPLLNEVVTNVTRLYHGTNRQEQAAANRWLMQFQRENSAWEVAASVLSFVQGLDEKRPELYLFAAQTLRKKIQRDLGGLPPDFQWKLRDTLLLYAAQYAHANAQVLTQICLSISALALRLPQWQDPLKDIFESLSAESLHGALVKLLEVLPEDCLEEGPGTFPRMEYMKELLPKTPQVLVFLQQRLSQGGGDIGLQRAVLDCLLGWVRLGGMSELPQETLPEHPLVAYSLDSLANPSLADVAASIVSELLQRHAVMSPGVLRLVPHFQATVLPRYVQQGEEEGVSAIVEVLTELGVSAPQLIAQATPDVMALCTILIGSITLPETCGWDPYTLPTTSLPFWSNEALVNRITSEQPQSSPFIPAYRQLLGALLISLRSDSEPDEKEGLVHLEDDLINFRSECEDALLATCQVLGPQQYLQQVLEGVQAWSNGQQPAKWEEIEVRMYLCEAIADETQKLLKKDQLPEITPLFQFIAGLPSNQPVNQQKGAPLVHNAAARVTSAFAKWLYSHPDAGSALLTFLVGALQSPVSAGASARALKHVCEEVTAVTSETSSLDGLLRIGENLPSFRLSAEQEEDVLSAVGAVLSEQSADRIAQGLHRLLRPNRLAIEALIEKPGPTASWPAAELHAYVQAINRLGALFRHVRSFPDGSDDPLAAILYSEWPLLERLLASPHAAEDSIAGAACQTLQDAVRATGVKFGALLSPFLLAMTRGFASPHPHPAYLRAASAASEELSSEPSIGPISLEALRVFSAASAVASIRTVEDADRQPEITEAYLHFVITFLRSSRRGVVAEALDQVQVALSIGAGCACASHRGVSASALSLVAAVMEAALPSSDETSAAVVPLVSLVVQSGRIIVQGLVQALLGISPMTKVHKISSIFQQLAALVIQHSGQPPEAGLALLQHWLASVLQALPTGCLRPGEAQAVPQIWGDSFMAAAADVSQHGGNERGRAGGGGYLGGDGGRRIKRVIRDFVDGHKV